MRPSKQQVDWLIYRNSMFRYINKGKDQSSACSYIHPGHRIVSINLCSHQTQDGCILEASQASQGFGVPSDGFGVSLNGAVHCKAISFSA